MENEANQLNINRRKFLLSFAAGAAAFLPQNAAAKRLPETREARQQINTDMSDYRELAARLNEDEKFLDEYGSVLGGNQNEFSAILFSCASFVKNNEFLPDIFASFQHELFKSRVMKSMEEQGLLFPTGHIEKARLDDLINSIIIVARQLGMRRRPR